MSLYYGKKLVTKMYSGSKEITKIYLGKKLVYQNVSPNNNEVYLSSEQESEEPK